MEDNLTFTYTYSAQLNQEVLAIRQRYMPRKESALEELRRLDHEVQMAGTVESLSLGIGGSLIFGLGMCMAMQVIGGGMVLGVLLGLVSTPVMAAAYPVYRRISSETKEKLTPRILELAERLSEKITDL